MTRRDSKPPSEATRSDESNPEHEDQSVLDQAKINKRDPKKLRASMNEALAGDASDSEPEPASFPPPQRAMKLPDTPLAARRGLPMRKIAIRTAQVLGILLCLGVIVVLLIVRHYEKNLPSVEQLKAGYDPPQVTRVLARDGTLLANLFTERRTLVAFSEIPDHVKQAFLAAEDASFYEHEGLDYLGMLRAMVANLRAGKTTQGGSTITQQVIKNVLLDSERSYRRKVRETILARRLEQYLTKDEIFGLYLNHIYLGHGRYGVEEASRYYFGKRVKEIDVAEAALLAGLVAAPERYSPRRFPERALERRRYVLGQMLAKGFMTKKLHGQASILPIKLAPAVEAESELCPEVVAIVKRTLERAAHDRAEQGGYTVHTAIDPTLQAAARKAVRDNLDAYAKRRKLLPPFTQTKNKLWGPVFEGTPKAYGIYAGVVVETNDDAGTIDVKVGDTLGRVVLKDENRYNPKRLPASKFTQEGALLRVSLLSTAGDHGGPVPLRLELGPQGALVAIDVRTREVRAIVGSYEAIMGGLDRSGSNASADSLLSKRQPGSSFKPLMYSYALHSRRFTPATVLELEPERGKDEPRRISLRMGVAKSDNAVAARVLEEVGAENVVRWAHAMGVNSTLKPTPSLALGAYEVSVYELTNAYATLASGGTAASARIITKIDAPDGSTLELPPEPPKRRVMSREEAYLTTSLLQSVVEKGTAQKARSLGRPVAGKTGTTNDNRDAWFVGYSTDIVAGTWVGYDDNISLGDREYGGVAALPAWIEFMKAAHGDQPKTQFSRPPKIVTEHIDPRTGLLPYPGQEDQVLEEFLDGTLPEDVAKPPEAGDELASEGENGDEPSEVPATSHTPGENAPDDSPPAPETPPAGDMAGAPVPENTNATPQSPDASPALPDTEPPPF